MIEKIANWDVKNQNKKQNTFLDFMKNAVDNIVELFIISYNVEKGNCIAVYSYKIFIVFLILPIFFVL